MHYVEGFVEVVVRQLSVFTPEQLATAIAIGAMLLYFRVFVMGLRATPIT